MDDVSKRHIKPKKFKFKVLSNSADIKENPFFCQCYFF